jgi:hypothetical protein
VFFLSRCLSFFFILLLSNTLLFAQGGKKVLDASPVDEKIVIDGKLDDAAWKRARKTDRFIQNKPQPGTPSVRRTEVSVLYDNNAVYIGAMLYDNPDSIYRQLSPRDNYDDYNTDVFSVLFDTYNDGENAFGFLVTAAGVQGDAKIKFDGVDFSWNAAWYSRVSMNDSGWCVEMKVPYSAIRFPKREIQKWGLNFSRIIRRRREESYWSAVMPGVPNLLSESGTLEGVHDIISPIRLAFLPYVSTYAENYSGANAHSFNGGMDIKYGFNESFTLDMTLVPDFGQTLYDNRVLNLSPFEVRYDEKRYFFTEGFDLFNKDDLFYSRRVGGTPVNSGVVSADLLGNEVITENPVDTRLYNATKITGRTRHNLGIGFFNAVTAPAYATARDTATGISRKLQTAPLSNYNVVVLEQALKNNSYISFVNTNVLRQQNSYNADVSALLFKFANKANTYGIDGSTDVSQLYYPTRQDIGYRYYFDLGKISGNYTWYLKTRNISDNFNPNDLGYLDRNNITYYTYEHYYNIFKPFSNAFGNFTSSYNHAGLEYYREYNPSAFRQFDIYGSHNLTNRNYHTVGFYWSLMPVKGYDYDEPRAFGRYYVYPKNYMVGGYISSDYRKKLALDISVTEKSFSERGRNAFSWSFSPRYRFSNRFSMIYSLSGQNNINDAGFVDKVNDSIYFGTRDVNTLTNTLDATYIFNSLMSLKLDARHYWSQARYLQYSLLNSDGVLAATNYNTDHNINFNSFNVFMSLVWQFKPGSEMSVVYQNAIYASGSNILTNYFNDADYTFHAPQSNSLSVKVIYYLDYLLLKNAFGKG